MSSIKTDTPLGLPNSYLFTFNSSKSSTNGKIIILQAIAAATAGLMGTPLMNISNKCSLPGITLNDVLAMTRSKPWLGATWASSRQFVSSIRGTVAVTLLTKASKDNEGIITTTNFIKAVFAGGLAESVLAGLLIEVPETRVQSGLSRYSFAAMKSFPFLLSRNILTAISPCYFIMQNINNNHQMNDKKTRSEWTNAIGRTLALSITIAVIASPLQGVVARTMQEQDLWPAIQNTRKDFLWVNRHLTFARVATRAMYTGKSQQLAT